MEHSEDIRISSYNQLLTDNPSIPKEEFSGFTKRSIEVTMNYHGIGMFTLITEERDIPDILDAHTVRLEANQKHTFQLTESGLHTHYILLLRCYGGMWEIKVTTDTKKISALDIVSKGKCLKPSSISGWYEGYSFQ